MIRSPRLIKLASLILCIFIIRCSPVTPTVRNLNEAHQAFLKLCNEEYDLNVKLFPLKNTVWIYVPIEDDIFSIKATGNGGIVQSRQAKQTIQLNYIDSGYEEDTIKVAYAVTPFNKYYKDIGFGTTYNETFTNAYRAVFQAIARTYFETQETSPPGENANDSATTGDNSNDVPEFFVVVLADIANGIEVKLIFNYTDYKKEVSQAIAMDESPLRRITESSGNKNIIGDKEGNYLEIKEVTWREFITRQINNRINFAYNQSSRDTTRLHPEDLMFDAIARTVAVYDFKDFDSTELINLTNELTESRSRDEILAYDLTALEPKGKLHTITFDELGKIKDQVTEELKKRPVSLESEPSSPSPSDDLLYTSE